nr:uncharacterized protein LOC113808851 [Penaeus vannamei]
MLIYLDTDAFIAVYVYTNKTVSNARLPNKELPPSTTVKFPRWNSTKEHFADCPTKSSPHPPQSSSLAGTPPRNTSPSRLPNKELPPSTTVKFPRWNSTKEHFAVVSEVNLTVALSIFGEDLVLCWDGNQTAVKASEGDCQGLPAREVHKVTLDYETQEIKSADGRVLRRLNSTNANKDDLMKMKADGGKAWAVQSLGDWPHPHDQDQSTDNQVE